MKVLGNTTSRIILSPSDFLYINKGIGNIWFNSSAGTYSTWKQIYQGFNVFPQGIDKSRILGAEVTLWGEVSNDDTLENNIWMRATAFGEKLWSDKVRTVKDLVKEIVAIEDELIKMGVSPSPIVSEFCEKFTDKCLLS
jgi:hexosaminidase